MAKKYSYHPPGYDPTQDRLPPRRASLGPLLTCGAGILAAVVFCAFAGGLFISSRTSTASAVTQTASPSATLDDWSATGTAMYHLTFTPTITPTPTATGAPTYTPAPTLTVDDWSATGTAIYYLTATAATPTPWPTETLMPTYTPPPTYTPAPRQPVYSGSSRPQVVYVTVPRRAEECPATL